VKHEQNRVSLTRFIQEAKKAWHGMKLDQPDWSDHSFSVALNAELQSEGLRFHLILNAYWESLEFELPKLTRGTWRRWIDTSLDSPHDIVPWEEAPETQADTYRVGDRSVAMLYSIRAG
jgi:glycogen operon protein